LDAIPYARYCVACARRYEDGADINLNRGRPVAWGSTLEHPAAVAARMREGEQSPFTAPAPEAASFQERDGHAAGTPGGGSAVGGLAGINAGDGDPDDEQLENAMGSSEFDVAAAPDQALRHTVEPGPEREEFGE